MVNPQLLKKLKELKSDLEVSSMKEIQSKCFLSSQGYECTLNNGKVIKRECILKNKGDGSAVIVLPITHDLQTILVVQPRVFTRSKIGIELPAGYIDESESPEEAALRELREETGFTTNSLIKLCSYYQDQGCSKAYNHCFLAQNCIKTSKQNLDSDEFIHCISCSFQDVCDLVDTSLIEDAGSILTIEKAKQLILR